MMMNLSEQISRIKQVMNLNESDDNDSDFIFSLFDDFTRKANIYYKPENESIWMILPEEKKWVFELDANGTLWYNYYFFNGIFKYLSLNVIDNQHYITKWVEDILKKGAKHTQWSNDEDEGGVEDTLKKGVKHTKGEKSQLRVAVEDTLKKGVKHTRRLSKRLSPNVEDTLKRGKKLNNDDELK